MRTLPHNFLSCQCSNCARRHTERQLTVTQLTGKPVAESEYSDPADFLVVGSAKEVLEDRMRRAEPQQGTAVCAPRFYRTLHHTHTLNHGETL